MVPGAILAPTSALMSEKMACTVRINKYGDRGHPCLIPNFRFFQSDSHPSCFTLKVGALYNALVMLIILVGMLNLDRVSNILCWSILSNAFPNPGNRTSQRTLIETSIKDTNEFLGRRAGEP